MQINPENTEEAQDNYKPAIAHRDIKTKNILVREDTFTCVIADFGLAVTYDSRKAELNVKENYRVGTKRYMSPEILDDSIENNKTFESYKRADVYAMALVMWEVLRKTSFTNKMLSEEIPSQRIEAEPLLTSNECNEYVLPYHLDVGPDPSFEEMKKVVCIDKRRPDLPILWSSGQNPFFAGLVNIMKECWHEKPDVRQSMLRIKKNLQELQRHAIELDTHDDNSSSCYFSLYGPTRLNRNLNRNVSQNSNSVSEFGLNRENPRRLQYNILNGIRGGRDMGFSRHSITGGGGNRAIGDAFGAAGSGSVNSTLTQTSYCSSGYQSKLGSQSGSVDQSGLGDAIPTARSTEIPNTPSISTYPNPAQILRNESQQGTLPFNTATAHGPNILSAHSLRSNEAPILQFRNIVPRSIINRAPLDNAMLDEQEEDGTNS